MSKKSHLANRTKAKRSRVTRVRAAKSNSQIVREALREKNPVVAVDPRAIDAYLYDLVSSYPWKA